MNRIILLSVLALSTFFSYSQDIANITQGSPNYINEPLLIVYDIRNYEIARRNIYAGYKLSGFSTNIIVINNKKQVIVYDQKFREISRRYLTEGFKVMNVIGNNFIIKTPDKYIITYDKNFSEIAKRHE
jgi:hypothetical protein